MQRCVSVEPCPLLSMAPISDQKHNQVERIRCSFLELAVRLPPPTAMRHASITSFADSYAACESEEFDRGD